MLLCVDPFISNHNSILVSIDGGEVRYLDGVVPCASVMYDSEWQGNIYIDGAKSPAAPAGTLRRAIQDDLLRKAFEMVRAFCTIG